MRRKDMGYDLRHKALIDYLNKQGITNTNVLKAFSTVPRHLFVPTNLRDLAYDDTALPIGYGQTISQPSLIAYILQKLNLSFNDSVLEVGAGSGYLAALLSQLVQTVYAIETIKDLANTSSQLLKALNFSNIYLKCRDGTNGWPEAVPFDAIIFSASTSIISPDIFNQLTNNGQLIAPIETKGNTVLKLYKRQNSVIISEDLLPVKFVPLVSATTNR